MRDHFDPFTGAALEVLGWSVVVNGRRIGPKEARVLASRGRLDWRLIEALDHHESTCGYCKSALVRMPKDRGFVWRCEGCGRSWK